MTRLLLDVLVVGVRVLLMNVAHVDTRLVVLLVLLPLLLLKLLL